MKRMIIGAAAVGAVFFAAGAVFASNPVKECVPKGPNLAFLSPNAKGECPKVVKSGYTLEELGAEGKEGKQGSTGPQGPTGPSGASHGYSATSANVSIPEGKNLVAKAVVSVKVPAGDYMVWASGNLRAHEGAVTCSLAGAPEVLYTFEEARLPYALNAAVSLNAPGEIALACKDEVPGKEAPEAVTNEITALKVDELN